MNNDLFSLLIQSSGAAAVTTIFVIYLKGFNKLIHEERQQTNTLIAEYLKESTRVKQHLAERLQEFSDVSREQKDVIEKLYHELMKKQRRIKAYESNSSGGN